MYNELINVLSLWGTDIHTLDFKHHDNFTEVLINKHYIIKINI